MATLPLRNLLHKKPASKEPPEEPEEETTLSPTMRELLVSFEAQYGHHEAGDGIRPAHQQQDPQS